MAMDKAKFFHIVHNMKKDQLRDMCLELGNCLDEMIQDSVDVDEIGDIKEVSKQSDETIKKAMTLLMYK